MLKLDITDKVRVGLNDGDRMPLERCVCGDESEPWEGLVLDTDPEDKSKCPNCGRKMWFEISIRVFQELREEDRSSNRPLVPYNRPISDELFTIMSGGFSEFDYDDKGGNDEPRDGS